MPLSAAIHRLRLAGRPQTTVNENTPQNPQINSLIAIKSNEAKSEETPSLPLLAETALHLSTADAYNIPTETTGWLWNRWETKVTVVQKNLKEQEKFLLDLQKTSVSLSARIDRFDEGAATMIDIITFTTAALSIVLTAIAASDVLNASANKTVQITISAVTSGFSIFSNLVSKQVTAMRNQALQYKSEVEELLVTIKPRSS